MSGKVDGRLVVIGNADFMKASCVKVSPLVARADELRRDGATAIYVGVDGKPAGVLAIADPIKPTTAEAIPPAIQIHGKNLAR